MDLMSEVPHTSKEKGEKKQKKNLRFNLSLAKTSDNSCPEFSYSDLVKEACKKNKGKVANGIAEDDLKGKTEAEAIASYYEAKYGGGPSKKRRKRDRAKDLADVGYGYDETDPFVDNSECYDEVVPTSLTTQFGGFYINSGKLEFKHVSDDSNMDQDDDDDDDDDESLPLSVHLKKRRKLVSDSESGEDFKDSHILKKKAMKRKGSLDVDKRRRKLSLQGKDKIGKLGKGAKKKQTKVQLLVAKAKAQHHLSSSGSDKPGGSKLNHTSHNLSNGRSTSTTSSGSSERDLLDLIDEQHKTSARKPGITPEAQRKEGAFKSPIANDLPLSIPSLVKEKISSLTKIAKTNEKEGKMKFFSPDVNKLLLGIEAGSQNLSNRERSGIYQHLTPHVPCSKDTLIKRMKKLHATKQDETLKVPLEELKKAIDEVMDEQIMRYDQECAAQQLAKSDDRAALAASTDEDDDGLGTQAQGEEKTKRTYAPRRKFKWNDKLGELLHNLVKVKLEQFESRQKTNQTAEEHLKNFFENEVKNLWPKGWMQARTLFKESRECHGHLTGSLPKQKKVISASKKTLAGAKADKKLGSASTSSSPTPSGSNSSSKLLNGVDNFAGAAKASKQLFRDHHKPADSSLCVSLNLDCDAVPEKLQEQRQTDLMHRAIASAQREAAAHRRSAPVKANSAKEAVKANQASKEAPKLAKQADDKTIKVWNEATYKPPSSGVVKSAAGSAKESKDAGSAAKPSAAHHPSSSTPSSGKAQAKKNKTAPSNVQAAMDQYNSELWKYAMMMNPAGASVDSQILGALTSMAYHPPVMATTPNPTVDSMTNFIKMQQAALQKQLQQTAPSFQQQTQPYHKFSTKTSPQSKSETCKSSTAATKKTPPSSTTTAAKSLAPRLHQASAATDASLGAPRSSKHVAMHSAPPGGPSPDLSKQSPNGALKFADSSPRGSNLASTVSKPGDAQRKHTFVAPAPPSGGRYSLPHTSHAIQRSAADLHYMKGGTSPLPPSVPSKHSPSTLASLSPSSSSVYSGPVYQHFHAPSSVKAEGLYSNSVPRSAVAKSPLPVKPSPSAHSGYAEQFLKFNQLPSPTLPKVSGNAVHVDLDKAAMDALLSAHMQAGTRR